MSCKALFVKALLAYKKLVMNCIIAQAKPISCFLYPNKIATFMKMKLLLAILICCSSLTPLRAQAFARSWDAWFGQLQVGAATGMQQTAASYTLGLYKSVQNHGYGLDFGGTTLNNSRILYGNLTLSQDLLRITRNMRSPLYLYGSVGLGLTHLRNDQLQDNFLLRGDDMIHLQVGLSPTYFFSRDFALQLSGKFQTQTLVDYELDQLWSVNLGIFFLIPNFKPF